MIAQVDHKSDFQVNGYTIMRQFFTAQESEGILAKIRRAQQEIQDRSRLDKNGLEFKHNLYRHSREMQEFVSQQRIVHFLRDIIGPDFWCRWDQTVEKVPGGAEFPWHQDNGYNGLVDGHFQFWVALSPMTPENGGLYLQPGSHRNGKLPHHVQGNHLVCPGDPSKAVFIDAEPGDCVLFSSFMLHATSPNVTNVGRLAYVIEYMSCEHYDPFIPAPYFIVARNGEPAPEFVSSYKGRVNLANQLKYLPMRVGRGLHSMRRGLVGMIRGKQEPARN